jgi:valyl-tRNA synthetase
MRARFEDWIEGLNGDWLISRQRYFGVPIPLWYRVDAEGATNYDEVLVPAESRLPVDPTTDCPDGFTPDQRDQPGGFTGDTDVMDTWATSSLTPQISGDWTGDPAGDAVLFDRVFPYDMRPQAHDIIRTWLFATVVRSHHEHDVAPWRHAAISGWILDPDRKKMSKSKGNVVTPMALLEQYGTDAVRYWAASGRPGVDTAFDDAQMKIGRKLATKLLNATKFVLGIGEPQSGAQVTETLDLAMLARLDQVVTEATAAFDEYDYARALERTEAFFWWFCDDYVELVKDRAYGVLEGGHGSDSARAALREALDTMHRLFAPFMPFVAEEVWSWWHDTSVHAQGWPQPRELAAAGNGLAADSGFLDSLSEVLAAVRRAKTEAKVSQKAVVESLVVTAPADVAAQLGHAEVDLRRAGSINVLRYETAPDGAPVACAVALAG